MTKQNEVRVGVGAIVFRGNDVLLIKRGKPPMKDHWSIPGGGLEVGETLLEGVAREVHEETRCEIKVDQLIDVFEAIPAPKDSNIYRHTVMINYLAIWVSGEPVAGDDAAEAEFVNIEEAMARLSWDETRRALSQAVQLRCD